jgi:hypothetical protein
MQKSLQKCLTLLHRIANFQTNQIFLLERARSEVQTLYQTYFSRTNLSRKKWQKPTTSKKLLATSPSLDVVF